MLPYDSSIREGDIKAEQHPLDPIPQHTPATCHAELLPALVMRVSGASALNIIVPYAFRRPYLKRLRGAVGAACEQASPCRAKEIREAGYELGVLPY